MSPTSVLGFVTGMPQAEFRSSCESFAAEWFDIESMTGARMFCAQCKHSGSFSGMDALRRTTVECDTDTWTDVLRSLTRCGRTAQRALTAQLDDRLGPSQAALLWTCREMAGTEPSQLDLAKRLGLSPAQVSGMVEQLRREGLLRSERSPADRRRQTWRLTAKGRRLLSDLDQQLAAWSAACRDEFGAAALDEISRGIHAMEQFIDRLGDARHSSTPTDDASGRGAAA